MVNTRCAGNAKGPIPPVGVHDLSETNARVTLNHIDTKLIVFINLAESKIGFIRLSCGIKALLAALKEDRLEHPNATIQCGWFGVCDLFHLTPLSYGIMNCCSIITIGQTIV